MSSAIDLLMSSRSAPTTFSEESPICTIEPKTRTIFVPAEIVVGGGAI